MSDFPSLSDIEAHLQALGLLVGDLPATLDGIADAAVLQWERDTGYLGWLPESASYLLPVKQHLVIPPSGIITLDSIEYQGSVLSAEQYRLLPVDHHALRVPAQLIRLDSQYGGEVTVTATYGWSAVDGEQVPADVWHAVLLAGSLLVSSNLTDSLTGPVTSVRQGDIAYQWSSDGAESRVANWRSVYQTTVARYSRWGVV